MSNWYEVYKRLVKRPVSYINFNPDLYVNVQWLHDTYPWILEGIDRGKAFYFSKDFMKKIHEDGGIVKIVRVVNDLGILKARETDINMIAPEAGVIDPVFYFTSDFPGSRKYHLSFGSIPEGLFRSCNDIGMQVDQEALQIFYKDHMRFLSNHRFKGAYKLKCSHIKGAMLIEGLIHSYDCKLSDSKSWDTIPEGEIEALAVDAQIIRDLDFRKFPKYPYPEYVLKTHSVVEHVRPFASVDELVASGFNCGQMLKPRDPSSEYYRTLSVIDGGHDLRWWYDNYETMDGKKIGVEEDYQKVLLSMRDDYVFEKKLVYQEKT